MGVRGSSRMGGGGVRAMLMACLAVTCCLCALAALAGATVPVIERVDMEATRAPQLSQPEMVARVQVRDADGAADLAGVTFLRPEFGETVVTPTSGPGTEWTVQGPDLVQVTLTDPWVVSGTYEIRAIDAEGNQDTATAPSAPAASDYPITCGIGVYESSSTVEVTPDITWSTGIPGGATTLRVYRAPRSLIWEYALDASSYDMSLAYNTDGTVVEPQLSPGANYGLEIETRLAEDMGVTDPRVSVWQVERAERSFAVCTTTPTVVSAALATTAETISPGVRAYWERLDVVAADADGIYDLASITATSPSGQSIKAIGFSQDGEYGMAARCYFDPVPSAPWGGQFTVTAEDTAGHTGSYSFTLGPSPGEGEVIEPVMDSVIATTAPSFGWSVPRSSAYSEMWLYEEGMGLIWSRFAVGEQQVSYNCDGLATEPELRPGHSYIWTAYAWVQHSVDDVRLSVVSDYPTWGRFTVAGPVQQSPALPGKLSYGTFSSADAPGEVRQYSADADTPSWAGPVGAESPDWTPDGSALMYLDDGILWTDSLDGTQPTGISLPDAEDSRMSPDGTRVAYSLGIQAGFGGSSDREIWTCNADGSDQRAVAAAVGDNERYPDWSPDGQWISFSCFNDANGQACWLVRPDGTEAHAVAATGVIGYPDCTVSYLGEPAWSPEGSRLAVAFQAEDQVGGLLSGIGVISVNGGMLTPVFIAPAGIVCCAAPAFPSWSPQGGQIVFASGHHLVPNSAWSNGAFEPEVELWVVNSDGSDAPVRLTYDHSYDEQVSWWAPTLFSDVQLGFWAISAIGACSRAGIVAGYPDGTYKPTEPVTRDQMAVYISRALAGGDAKVPTGPATATFSDVPTDNWAFKYVEYAVSKAVVKGYSDGTYKPTDQVDRGQMSVFIARAIATPTAGADLANYTPPATATFPDVPTSFWAYKYVEYIAQPAIGVTMGYPDGDYHPEYICTRDQMAVYIQRAFHLPL